MSDEQRLGDAPIEPEFYHLMNVVAEVLDTMFNGDTKPKEVGFCLLVFPFGDGAGRCNYISNARREDVVVLLKEQLARFQGMPSVEGRG